MERLNELLNGRIDRLERLLRGHLHGPLVQFVKTSQRLHNAGGAQRALLYGALVAGPCVVGYGMLTLSGGPGGNSAGTLTGVPAVQGGQAEVVQTMLRDLEGKTAREKLETAAEANKRFMRAQGYDQGASTVDWEARKRLRESGVY
eukprot:g2803.t1